MIKELLQQFKGLIILASGLSTLSAASGIAMLAMITDTIDHLSKGESELTHPFILFVLFVLLVMSLGYLSQYLLLKLSNKIVYQVRTKLLQRILATRYEQIEKIGGHKVMATMESDVTTLSNGLLLFPNFIYNSVTVLFCLGFMLYSSWQLFLLVLVLFFLIGIASLAILSYVHRHQEILREYDDSLFLYLKSLVNGGKEIYMNVNRRRHFYEVLMLPLFKKIQEKTIKAESLIIILETYTGTLIFFLIGAVVYGVHAFLPEIEMQVAVAFVLVILYIVEPLSEVVNIAGKVNNVQVSINKIERLGLSEATGFSLSLFKNTHTVNEVKKLSIEGVCYQYPASDALSDTLEKHDEISEANDDYRFSLGPVSAEFKAGEISFLVGGNGSGKSTFAKLITGLYPIKAGVLRINEKVLESTISMAAYQSCFSTIFSDAYVFDHLLTPEGQPADDRIVNDIIKKLGMDDKVSSKLGVLSSTNLSQGQKKRLAILTSFVEDASICVYDELAAEQDPNFKRYFYTELLPELKQMGKIIIIISHDDQYFSCADQILKFEEGKIIKSHN